MGAFVSLLPSLIGLGISGIGSLFGKKKGSTQAGGAENAFTSPWTTEGAGDVAGAGNFYRGILSGNRDLAAQLLGPQVSTVLDQYDNAAKATREFAPRGGGKTETLASMSFAKVGAYQRALNTAVPSAAAGLSDTGAKLGAIGLGQSGQTNQFNQGQNFLNFQKQLEQNQQFSGLGKGLGTILTNVFNKRKGGGGGSWTPSDVGAGGDF